MKQIECNNCGKIIVDGDKHRDEEDLCDQCKIADLEAKLAESERVAENNKKVAELVSAEHNTKIQNLEQQLAEKEKSFKFKICRMCEQEFNQDKIELLEKVKDLLFDKAGEITGTSIAVVRLCSIIEIFDNLINELKEKK